MSRREFDRQLESLRGDVLALGRTVVARLETVSEALETGRWRPARRVIEGDEEVDQR